jgi:hypothetical protein
MDVNLKQEALIILIISAMVSYLVSEIILLP